MKIAAILPAKGTSERIESKNMKLICGKPLFLHMLEKLCKIKAIDEVYLDSDSDEILKYADYLNYIPLKRDPKLANNKTNGNALFMSEVKQIEADMYIQIFCTSPFIKAKTIERGITILKEHSEYDSVALIRKEKLYLWDEKQPLYSVANTPNSKDLSPTYSDTMMMYMVRRGAALKYGLRVGKKPYPLIAEPIETIDINNPEDLEVAEKIFQGIIQQEYAYFNSIKHFFNSAIFADVLYEMGVESTITQMQLNLPNKKIMGRANTLKIRAIKDGEDYHEIYETYKTYDKIRQGEIIMVENEIPDKAYFGELNANLAIRSGAIGTVVSGVTRDIEAVGRLDYPVFSKGYSCSDIKGRATFVHHNKPIKIHGVRIVPGDLVFADINGIVVIPQEIEKIVLLKAMETAVSEKKVSDMILNRKEAYSIYQEIGEF